MSMKIELALRPFTVPNFVAVELPPRPRQEGFDPEGGTFPLSLVDEETLAELCEIFREEVFKKAGKKDPKYTKAVTMKDR